MQAQMQAVLVSNGPGELYTWVQPVLAELRRYPLRAHLHIHIGLVPCQFASGAETRIAATFGADSVSSPGDFARFMALGKRLPGLEHPTPNGFVLSLGGSAGMALDLGKRLGYPVYRYSFVPTWHRKLAALFVHDARAERRARLLGAPRERLEQVGNLVADAVKLAEPAPEPGNPHVLLMPGSRDAFAVHLIPLMIALADALGERYPQARFVWPVSRLLSEEAVKTGIQGAHKETLGGMAGKLEDEASNRRVITPEGHALELAFESSRYAHMRAADLAVTIPGTNTLELGVAGVPGIVLLPLNKPEVIPLEGPGHWLSLVPWVGAALKRQAVRLAAPHFPVALPNLLSGEDLMVEMKGEIVLGEVVDKAVALLTDPEERARRRGRLLETMPPPGAAARLVERVLLECGS